MTILQVVDERCQRVSEAIHECGADCALLTNFDSICYATGYVSDLESGPSAFAGGPAMAIVLQNGESILILSNAELGAAPLAAQVVEYEGFSKEYDPPRPKAYLDRIVSTFKDLGLDGIVAVEPASFPLAVGNALGSRVTRVEDIRAALAQQRATKTANEMESLRASAELARVGQEAALASVAAGRTEIEAFGAIRTAIESRAGERVLVVADILSGVERTAGAMGPPTSRTISDGDAVICDLVPRYHGYWGDSSTTIQLGDASDEFRALYETVLRAMEAATEFLRPGIAACELDRVIRSMVENAGYELPLHLGHGIGCANFEYPLIVPQETAVLRPDMVLMLEPGAYAGTIGGARLEWMFRITETGNELMSTFQFQKI